MVLSALVNRVGQTDSPCVGVGLAAMSMVHFTEDAANHLVLAEVYLYTSQFKVTPSTLVKQHVKSNFLRTTSWTELVTVARVRDSLRSCESSLIAHRAYN